MNAIPLPSQARLKELLDYDPLTGGLVWKFHQRRTDYIGKEAGSRQRDGHRAVRIDFKLYMTHRLIWMLQTGEDPKDIEVDHKDRNPLNNCWSNLRLATRSQNTCNRKVNAGKTLPKGVTKKSTGRYQARITCNGNRIHLGNFDTPEEAHQVYCEAAARLHGEFACLA